MNRNTLIEEIATQANLSKASARAAMNAMLQSISSTLAKEGVVQLVGFGTFKVVHRSERQGRNPRTGELMTIPATKIPSFSAGKGLKTQINLG